MCIRQRSRRRFGIRAEIWWWKPRWRREPKQLDTCGAREKTVLVNFCSFRESGTFDGAIDAERESQLAVDKLRTFQSGERVGEKALFGGDCRYTLILKIVGAGYANAARAVHVDAVAVNIDGLARNSEIFELEVGGDRGERSGIFLCGAEIVEMSQLHQVCVEHQAWDLTVGDLQMPDSSHSREWTGGVLDGPRKLKVSVQ